MKVDSERASGGAYAQRAHAIYVGVLASLRESPDVAGGSHFRDAYSLAALTGMRRSELFRLKWPDIYLKSATNSSFNRWFLFAPLLVHQMVAGRRQSPISHIVSAC